jgi:hypothetical protein
MLRLSLATAAALLALGAPRAADAHEASFTYGRLTASPDGRRVDYALELRAADLAEALGDPDGGEPDEAALRAGEARLYDYVAARIALAAPAQTGCRLERAPLALRQQAERFVVLGLGLVCPARIAEVVLDYDLFFDLDPGHTGLVTVDGEIVRLRAPDDTRLTWSVGEPPIEGLGGFVLSGVEHIRTGLDHILFLVALLLVVVVRRGDDGELVARPLGAALRSTAAIVTSFTVAHSLTLIAAALGWFELPSRLVESVIAASIVFVALEDVVRLDPPRRAVVTFGFGLVHGLGFAAMLAPLLPPDRVVLPLLAFNLGVELGQLALVALVLPLLYAVVRALGAVRYRATVVRFGALACAALGLIWLVERALGITILGL